MKKIYQVNVYEGDNKHRTKKKGLCRNFKNKEDAAAHAKLHKADKKIVLQRVITMGDWK